MSDMVRIDAIAPSIGNLVLCGRKMLKTAYGKLEEESPLYTQTHELMERFQAIVRADAEQSELEGILRFATWAGNYSDSVHRETWHSDNFNHPSVRWTAAFGVGSTAGARGMVCKKNTLSCGDLGPGMVGEDRQLRPLYFPEGTVTRFMNSGDIHAGPWGNGARIMLQATLRLMHPARA
jgi:hypothetical protein